MIPVATAIIRVAIAITAVHMTILSACFLYSSTLFRSPWMLLSMIVPSFCSTRRSVGGVGGSSGAGALSAGLFGIYLIAITQIKVSKWSYALAIVYNFSRA